MEIADELISKELRSGTVTEALDAPPQAEAILAKFHYLPDPRRRLADDGWYVHEHGHRALVLADPTAGVRYQHYYNRNNEDRAEFRSGMGVLSLEDTLMALHARGLP